MESFENIYFDISKEPGKCRFADSGLGWKPSGGGDTFTLDKDQISSAQWSRAAKGFEVKIVTRASDTNQFDGFQEEDHERLQRAFKVWYGIQLENKEHALRGWNWGKGEFSKSELTFNVQNRPAFEIPFSEISNTNLAGRNEVSVDFYIAPEGEENGVNGHMNGTKSKKGRKGHGARDQLVEARFYIPGTVMKKEKKESGDEASDADMDGEGEGEEQNAANLWYETLVDKAQIGEVAGDTFASFMDILHLTPRGRFDLDMYENSFRLRGKTYDYKIQYDSIRKFFILPKPDDLHYLITIGLDPPLRQGQTRYPFVVMQFKRDEDIELDMNITEEDLNTKYKDKIQEHYSGVIYSVITQLFRGLAGKKIISPSTDFRSRHQQSGVKCSVKANEGHLFCMDKSFLFVPKPATYIAMDHIQQITMSRVGGGGAAVTASRTFDMTFTLKGGAGEHAFSNINREEQQPLEEFFKRRNLKVRNEIAEDSAILAKALKEQDLDSDSDEVIAAARGSADEDSESEDEDFHEESDSDVAEEFDSAHESDGGSASDEDMAEGDADADADEPSEEEKDERPPKKKPKVK